MILFTSIYLKVFIIYRCFYLQAYIFTTSMLQQACYNGDRAIGHIFKRLDTVGGSLSLRRFFVTRKGFVVSRLGRPTSEADD